MVSPFLFVFWYPTLSRKGMEWKIRLRHRHPYTVTAFFAYVINGRYVTMILQLIQLAGDQLGDDIWHRLVQVVTNNKSLQAFKL